MFESEQFSRIMPADNGAISDDSRRALTQINGHPSHHGKYSNLNDYSAHIMGLDAKDLDNNKDFNQDLTISVEKYRGQNIRPYQ